MIIDVFSHIATKKFKDTLLKKTKSNLSTLTELFENYRVLSDLDLRLRVMNRYPDVLQVLVPAIPPLETLVSAADAPDLARLNNDEMAGLVEKYPDKFISSIALLPQNNVKASMNELERVVTKLDMRGILLHSNVNGETLDLVKFKPLFAQMAEYDLPVFIYPSYLKITNPPLSKELPSAYQHFFDEAVMQAIQWPAETTMAMIRLGVSGIFREYPSIKLVAHHCGGLIPFCQDRVILRDADDIHKFYGDTALVDTAGPLMCGYSFFGANHLLFGTGTPLGRVHGYGIRKTIRAIEELNIPAEDKEKIFERNALQLLRITI
jgi:aminocarboxymuconate-semialdehyde decarboxylase